MLGLPAGLTNETYAGVDRRHHAQRQALLRKHWPLLDMHFDKTQIARRIALQRPDGRHLPGQARGAHGITHGDALRILLIEPLRIEISGQRARPQEGGAEALAFLFGEGHELDVERQATAGT